MIRMPVRNQDMAILAHIQAVKCLMRKHIGGAVDHDIVNGCLRPSADILAAVRAGKFSETEIVFYAMDDLLNAQRDLNKMVDENLIQAEVPAHLYAIVGEQTVSATLKNSSKTDTYTIEIRRDSDGSLIADPITLAAGASVSSITLKDVPEYGNAACTATIKATRDGKTVGTLEVKTALHAAYLWPKEVMSK